MQHGSKLDQSAKPSERAQTAGGGSIPCGARVRLKTVDLPKGNGLGQKGKIGMSKTSRLKRAGFGFVFW